MATTEKHGVPADVLAELTQAAERAARGIRDPEAMRQACERMDRIREANRRKFGEADIGVEIIRSLRRGE